METLNLYPPAPETRLVPVLFQRMRSQVAKRRNQSSFAAWLAEERRGDTAVAELSVAQIREQLALAVNRVMAEGSLYDPDLAALAIKQARGDLIEAVFLIRAYRTTLPRLGESLPIDTAAMTLDRRVSATFKDLPGGQKRLSSMACQPVRAIAPTGAFSTRTAPWRLAASASPTT